MGNDRKWLVARLSECVHHLVQLGFDHHQDGCLAGESSKYDYNQLSAACRRLIDWVSFFFFSQRSIHITTCFQKTTVF